MMLPTRDSSKPRRTEVHRAEKSNALTEVALWTPKWPNDDLEGLVG